MTTPTRTDSKVGATCGNTGLDYPVGSQGLNSAPSRTEFEAAAYRYIRTMAGEELMYRLIMSQDRPCFDTAIAAAMGWPTVPEKGTPCSD